MCRNFVILLLLMSLAASCVPRGPVPIADDPELNAFVRDVEGQLEAHAWQEILGAVEESHYQTQVVDHGMGEPQYLAELFGLHHVENDIKQGDIVQWSDLERIQAVDIQELTPVDETYRLIGAVTLEDGTTLDLQARVSRVQGRYVLTGAVG